jgi:pyrimidine operon attenuation protein/uracil phosphoribosyltransferase
VAGGAASPVILAGIRDNGVVMAKILSRLLKEIAGLETEIIEVSLDKRHPEEIILSSAQRFNDRIIILVDDVTNSGKTLLYALKPFLHDHPQKIQILTLVSEPTKPSL